MRKRFVSLMAVLTVLAMLLSACGSKPADDKKPAEPVQEQKKEGIFHGAWPYDVPPKTHFNVFSTGNLSMPGSPYTELMTNPLAMYYWSSDTWEPLLATEWKLDNAANTITVNLRKGVKWSDGSDFKAQDLLTAMSIGNAKNYTVWRYVEKVTAKDEHTVEFKLNNPATIALRYILKTTPQPTSVYGEWAKKFQAEFDAGKARTSDEVKALVKEFDAFRPAEYVASGAFKMNVSTINEAQMTLEKVKTAWNADKVKFDKIVIYNGETAAVTPLVLDKKVDFATHAFPPATERQMVETGIRVVRYPFYTGPAIHFNHALAPFNQVEFRQALAHIINRDEAGVVALSKSGVGVKQMAGLSDNMIKTWVPAADAAKLNPYAQDAKKAEELLNKAGLKKGANGMWTDAAGKALEFELAVPSDFADWSAAAENIANQLTKFGIKTIIRGTPWSQYTTDMHAGKFQFGMLPWGSSIPHPQFAYLANLVNYNAGGQTGNKEKPGANFPLKVTYSGGSVDLDQLITDSGKGLDLNVQKQAIGKLAVAFNELLPIIPVFERYSNSPVLENVNAKGWPKDGDAILNNGSADNFVTIMILTGKLEPVK